MDEGPPVGTAALEGWALSLQPPALPSLGLEPLPVAVTDVPPEEALESLDRCLARDPVARTQAAVAELVSHYLPRALRERGEVCELVDFTVARGRVDDGLAGVLTELSADALLEAIRGRLGGAPAPEERCVLLEICARALGAGAIDIVRAEWGRGGPGAFFSMAEVLARSLPLEESFPLVAEAVERFDVEDRTMAMGALELFQSERALDWIERQLLPETAGALEIPTPYLMYWGKLAAVSRLDWDRALRWLAHGGRISLAALYALYICLGERDPPYRPAPVLFNRPEDATIARHLLDYQEADPRPLVGRIVRTILSYVGPGSG
jgi:hypothetical protein